MIIISGAAPHPYLIKIEYETHGNAFLLIADTNSSPISPKDER
jgi:hypothetical protein